MTSQHRDSSAANHTPPQLGQLPRRCSWPVSHLPVTSAAVASRRVAGDGKGAQLQKKGQRPRAAAPHTVLQQDVVGQD